MISPRFPSAIMTRAAPARLSHGRCFCCGIICLPGAHSFGLRGMTFWVRLIIYAGTVLLYVGTAAWIVRAWTRRRYRDKSPSDLHYIAVGIVLVVSAGLGVLVASQIVVVLGYTG